MPAKSQKKSNSENNTFRANIELSFINMQSSRSTKIEKVTKIEPDRIMYIMFNYEYFDKTMPMVIMYLNLPVKLYKQLIDRQEFAKIKLKIQGYNPLRPSSLSDVRLEHTFNYVTVNQNQPYGVNTNDTTDDDKYRGVYIGLVDNDMTNYLRTPFNGIYRDVKMSALLSLALQGYKKYTIEPFKYDYTYNQVLVPACSTRLKFLEFLYDYDQFYDDYFEYFIDFDNVYLLSQSGNGGSGTIESKKNVIIDVRPIDDSNSYKDGYSKQDNSIYMYVNQMDVSVNTNTASDQLANKVISYGERRDPQEYKLSDGDKVLFVRAGSSDDATSEVKNQIKTSTTLIELAKSNINDNIFTPSRIITLKMYDDYQQYSGKYKLYYKRVIYKIDQDGQFLVTTNIGLVPTGDTLSALAKIDRNSTSKAVSRTARKSTSADEHNGAISRSDYVDYEQEMSEQEMR